MTDEEFNKNYDVFNSFLTSDADLDHGDPIGPHWDYSDRKGNKYRVFPNGKVEKK